MARARVADADRVGLRERGIERFRKDVLIVETAYPWRSDWTPPARARGAMAWPVSPEGQARFLRDVVEAAAATPHGRGAGVIWWYPEAIRVPGLFVWGDGALALFDDSGAILPAASVFGAVGARRAKPASR